jgi:flagellar biosynthesis GTPase FlhF
MAAPEFTMTLLDDSDDLQLHTGEAKLEKEVQDKIAKCNGEYLRDRKSFRIPKEDLCLLLDECFDYFSEESLMNIAALLDSSKADERVVREVRERSVSKSKQQKPLEPARKKMKPIEERESLEKEDTRTRKEREKKEEKERKEKEEREKKEEKERKEKEEREKKEEKERKEKEEREKKEEKERKEKEEKERKEKEEKERKEERKQAYLAMTSFGKSTSPKEEVSRGPKVAFANDIKEDLLALADELRMKLDKMERFIHKNL